MKIIGIALKVDLTKNVCPTHFFQICFDITLMICSNHVSWCCKGELFYLKTFKYRNINFRRNNCNIIRQMALPCPSQSVTHFPPLPPLTFRLLHRLRAAPSKPCNPWAGDAPGVGPSHRGGGPTRQEEATGLWPAWRRYPTWLVEHERPRWQTGGFQSASSSWN